MKVSELAFISKIMRDLLWVFDNQILIASLVLH